MNAPLETPGVPPLEESLAYIRGLSKPSVAEVLRAAKRDGRVALQPRCGVGSHDSMVQLLGGLENEGRPDILSVTIDSHTRLLDFDAARRTLTADPGALNGYPLVTHGWRRGRLLNEAVRVPLEVRHGSPDGRRLFETCIASGITSFEGGGIGYNVPYAKSVPLAHSLAAWRQIDAACGDLAGEGILVDRELFGTLTAVLMPPSTSLAVIVLEAVSAARHGVRCISAAYPQGGEVVQDIAALRCIERLAATYLPAGIEVYPVMHEYMGPFPRDPRRADELIFYGALVARLGGAAKIVTKTNQEALGIPTRAANVHGILTSRLAQSDFLSFIELDSGRIEEEISWIEREVAELVEPLLDAPNLDRAIVQAFADGRLDVPFSTADCARRAVLPARDAAGAIRYLRHGQLPFSGEVLARNSRLLDGRRSSPGHLLRSIEDINHFAVGA